MPLVARDDSLLAVIDLQPRFWGERLERTTSGAPRKLRGARPG